MSDHPSCVRLTFLAQRGDRAGWRLGIGDESMLVILNLEDTESFLEAYPEPVTLLAGDPNRRLQLHELVSRRYPRLKRFLGEETG